MKRETQVGIGIVFMIVVAAGIVFAVDPMRARFLPTCFFHDLTGLYCPGCGSTRALHQLLHGHFLPALHDNALLVLLVPPLGGVLLWQTFSTRLARPWSINQLHPAWVWTLVAVVLTFGALRNIPLYPFTLLSP
jgi:hypothetical protein